MTLKSAEKVLSTLKAMRGHTLTGVSVSELVKQTGETPSQVCRYLATLVSQGFVRQDDNGLYYLSVAFVQIATAHKKEIELAEARIHEIRQLTL
ncbi:MULTISPECIES: helix-turn-helix domain-containing protein [Moraxella]|jgi:putative prophage DNA-binding protein|uniref:IclR family transcriptional regulator n=1 Tax=Moraxella lacunata TaxID=477 RepID=A0A1B8Q4W7_MORLA|nr:MULTISPECIES: helix-turn-helix domain-containing protein [Moraxella]MBE9577871.1 helix-turn-helix domain-containing protein [Moraxella sp. K1664]MBE9587293.1 helix-turn-helix domain-containing protein [Moraxella sp. K1630]MBE9595555.1 helix-turn-helix domain-containing protein [Moraxella sp. K2450]MDH9218153.1 helix-turn-helix domain-containing protein [Moraxella lacunata]MDI4481910.1 IclR family transcriptional regulator [Moraxella lacunata]